MKTFYLVLLSFSLLICASCKTDVLVVPAIQQVIRDFYANHSSGFDVIFYGKVMEKIGDVVNKVLRKVQVPVEVMKYIRGEASIYQSAILLFDTLKSYEYFHVRSYLRNKSPKDIKILVYIHETWKISEFSIDVYVKDEKIDLLRRESFLVPSEDGKFGLELLSFEQFVQPNCREWKWITLNRGQVENISSQTFTASTDVS
jgi:hypothetical protein